MRIKDFAFTVFLLSSILQLASCTEEKFNSNGNLLPPPSDTSNEDTNNSDDSDDTETIADGDEIIVDMNSYGGPDIAYWRGAQGPGVDGFFNTNGIRECLKINAENGMKIFNGTRRLATDPKKDDFFFLKDENGNYILDDDGDKIPATDPIPEYVDIKKYANELGYELICMLDGTPSWVIEVERDYHWGNPDFEDDPEKIDEGDSAPLPDEGKPMEQYQKLFIEFAKESDEAVAPDFHSIWIGTQEIAHTIGFAGGVKNITTQQEAIRRYIDFWKPIAEGIKANGGKVGGIQLNSDNANNDFYNYAVNYMKQQNLVLDYLTFQFYQWGNEFPMKKAAEAVRKYQSEMNLPNTKLIVDRGSQGKITDETKTASGKFITFLQGEKYCMNEADVVYAYTLDLGIGDFVNYKQYNNLTWQSKYWLMNCGDPKSPNKRRELENLPEGLDGFMTTKGNDLYGVIWNSGVSGLNQQKIELQLINPQTTYTNPPIVYKASGEILTKVKCKFSNNIISGVTLYSDEYLLIELKADN